jgi:hypothetical protein
MSKRRSKKGRTAEDRTATEAGHSLILGFLDDIERPVLRAEAAATEIKASAEDIKLGMQRVVDGMLEAGLITADQHNLLRAFLPPLDRLRRPRVRTAEKFER